MKFRKVRLCDLCSIVTDYVANGSFKTLADKVKYLNEGYARVIRLVDYNNKYSKKDSIWVSKESYEFLKKSKLYGGEIVLTNVGANLGTVFIAPQLEYPTTLGPNAIMIKTNENDKYLYYWLKSKNGQNTIKSIVTGSAMPKFNKTDLKNIEIAIPCIEDQDKIVEILSKIDKKIELNNQTNDNLYEITNKLYEQLFIIERQDDWKEYNIQELMDISNGYSYTGKELVDTSVVGMATIKNFERTGGFKEEGFKDIEPIKAKDVHYADKFDILVACTDLTQNADIIGNAIMILNSSRYEKVVISMDLVKILPKKNKYLVFSILNSKEFKNFALGYKTGTTVLHLNKNCFKDFNIRLPDLDKVENFEKMVETNYKKISYNLEENDTLIQLKDTLLPKLMNGEIDLDKIKI